MEHAGRLGSWGELYVMLGTSSAALLGLLFVASSLHLDDLARNSSYGTRARYNNFVLLLTLAEAALILLPQPVSALGAELVLLNLVMFCVTATLSYHFLVQSPVLGHRGGFSIHRSATFLAVWFAGAAGALLLFWQMFFGLYVVTIAYLVGLVTVSTNAWSIMTGVGRAEIRPRRRRKSVR
jgi:hypothetical protein